jgi:hypothetical protein
MRQKDHSKSAFYAKRAPKFPFGESWPILLLEQFFKPFQFRQSVI